MECPLSEWPLNEWAVNEWAFDEWALDEWPFNGRSVPFNLLNDCAFNECMSGHSMNGP